MRAAALALAGDEYILLSIPCLPAELVNAVLKEFPDEFRRHQHDYPAYENEPRASFIVTAEAAIGNVRVSLGADRAFVEVAS